MIPKIKRVKPLKNFILYIIFDDGKKCFYDVGKDIETIKGYEDLKYIYGLFEQVKLDKSRTCVFWNDFIDLPSDIIYEFATENANQPTSPAG